MLYQNVMILHRLNELYILKQVHGWHIHSVLFHHVNKTMNGGVFDLKHTFHWNSVLQLLFNFFNLANKSVSYHLQRCFGFSSQMHNNIDTVSSFVSNPMVDPYISIIGTSHSCTQIAMLLKFYFSKIIKIQNIQNLVYNSKFNLFLSEIKCSRDWIIKIFLNSLRMKNCLC